MASAWSAGAVTAAGLSSSGALTLNPGGLTTSGIVTAAGGVTASSLTAASVSVSGTVTAASYYMQYDLSTSTSPLTVSTGGSGSTAAVCTGSRKVLGGGCVLNSPYSTSADIKASYPSGSTQWTCVIHNTSGGDVVGAAWAVCGNVS